MTDKNNFWMAVIFYVFLLIFKIRRIGLLPLPWVSLTTILVDPYGEAPPIDKVQEKIGLGLYYIHTHNILLVIHLW